MSLELMLRIDPLRKVKLERALEAGDWSAAEALAEPTQIKFDDALVKRIVAEALKRFPTGSSDDALDQWLAARIHNCIRLSRRDAADSGIWTWFAVTYFRPYIHRRFGKPKSWWRFDDGNVLRNGVARLWWAAEIVRNGSSYDLVEPALRAVRVFQNVGELRYSWHREAARAFARVLQANQDLGNELSVVLNAYLVTHELEVFDTDSSPQQRNATDPDWLDDRPTLAELLGPVSKLKGPASGYTRNDVEAKLYEWLQSVFESAVPERKKSRKLRTQKRPSATKGKRHRTGSG